MVGHNNVLKFLAIFTKKMLLYSMEKFWNTIIDFMSTSWNVTIDFLAKINTWIPLAAVLLAGMGLVAIVLILAICGCIIRKRLVPNWLIWTYFTFATIIIFAHTGNDLAAIIADMEIPVLVVLICYILRTLFYRRPRYTYVRKEVYAREVAKGRAVKMVKTATEVTENDDAREVKFVNQTKQEKIDEKARLREIEKAEREAEAAKLAAAEKAAREAREAEKLAAEKAAREVITKEVKVEPTVNKRVDRNDFYNVKSAQTVNTQVNANSTVDMPVVQPIPGKAYEPTREPTIVTTPVSERMPNLKMPKNDIQLRYNNTPRTTTTVNNTVRTAPVVNRPITTTVTTPSRTATTETTTKPVNAFTAMYSPKIVKTTTTTTTSNTDTNTNTVDVVSASRTVNGNTTSATAIKASSSGTSPRSTQDIMAAIERLRASMKK